MTNAAAAVSNPVSRMIQAVAVHPTFNRPGVHTEQWRHALRHRRHAGDEAHDPLFVSVGRPALPGFGPSFTGCEPDACHQERRPLDLRRRLGRSMSADRTIANDRSDLTVANPSDDARVTEGARRSRFMIRTSTAQSLSHVAAHANRARQKKRGAGRFDEPVCHFPLISTDAGIDRRLSVTPAREPISALDNRRQWSRRAMASPCPNSVGPATTPGWTLRTKDG